MDTVADDLLENLRRLAESVRLNGAARVYNGALGADGELIISAISHIREVTAQRDDAAKAACDFDKRIGFLLNQAEKRMEDSAEYQICDHLRKEAAEALTQAAARIQVLEGELETARHAAIILHGDAEAVATYRLLRRERDAAQSERTVSEIRAQALESENGRMREALSFYRDSWTVPAQGPRNYPEPNMHLARDAGSFAANVLSALTGETA